MSSKNLHHRRQTRAVVVLHNRMAGAKSRSQQIRSLDAGLAARGFQVHTSEDLVEFSEMTAELHTSGDLQAAIAAGGDGTAAEAVNRAPSGVPVVVYPIGTENVLARYLGFRRDPAAIAEIVAEGEQIRLDACRANGKLFLLMIGVGFDADVVERLAAKRRGHISRWTYIKPLLASIRTYSYPELRVYCGNGDVELDGGETGSQPIARWVFGMNVPVYALRLKFAPKADPSDGHLDVCMFERGSFAQGIRYLVNVVTQRHLQSADVRMQRCTNMRIVAVGDLPVPYQLDGDPGGHLPVDVTIERGRFTTLVSADRAKKGC